MFGRRTQASEASPTAVAPPSAGSTESPTSKQRQKTIPAWLLPWLMPLVIVVAVVVLVVAPGLVAAVVALAAVAALGWLLFRANRSQDYYELTRNDRFLKRRDPYEMTRNDRFLKTRDQSEMAQNDRVDGDRSSE
jgi:hypothetical protein